MTLDVSQDGNMQKHKQIHENMRKYTMSNNRIAESQTECFAIFCKHEPKQEILIVPQYLVATKSLFLPFNCNIKVVAPVFSTSFQLYHGAVKFLNLISSGLQFKSQIYINELKCLKKKFCVNIHRDVYGGHSTDSN